MAEWKGIRFYKTEAESMKDQPVSGMDVNMSINDMTRRAKDEVEIDFTYSVDYKDDVAKLVLHGKIFMAGDAKELDGYVDGWRKTKKLPRELGAPLANIITFSSGVNGVLVSRALGMPAPIIPPNIKLGK